jgi:hypothetical protein
VLLDKQAQVKLIQFKGQIRNLVKKLKILIINKYSDSFK